MARIADVWAVIPRGTNEPQDWRTAMAQILVVVESDTGQRGYGVGGGGIAGIHVIDSVLREVVVGQDPGDVEAIWQRMYMATHHFGRKGLAIMALSGIDLAIWDLLGKLEGPAGLRPARGAASRAGAGLHRARAVHRRGREARVPPREAAPAKGWRHAA